MGIELMVIEVMSTLLSEEAIIWRFLNITWIWTTSGSAILLKSLLTAWGLWQTRIWGVLNERILMKLPCFHWTVICSVSHSWLPLCFVCPILTGLFVSNFWCSSWDNWSSRFKAKNGCDNVDWYKLAAGTNNLSNFVFQKFKDAVQCHCQSYQFGIVFLDSQVLIIDWCYHFGVVCLAHVSGDLFESCRILPHIWIILDKFRELSNWTDFGGVFEFHSAGFP